MTEHLLFVVQTGAEPTWYSSATMAHIKARFKLEPTLVRSVDEALTLSLNTAQYATIIFSGCMIVGDPSDMFQGFKDQGMIISGDLKLVDDGIYFDETVVMVNVSAWASAGRPRFDTPNMKHTPQFTIEENGEWLIADGLRATSPSNNSHGAAIAGIQLSKFKKLVPLKMDCMFQLHYKNPYHRYYSESVFAEKYREKTRVTDTQELFENLPAMKVTRLVAHAASGRNVRILVDHFKPEIVHLFGSSEEVFNASRWFPSVPKMMNEIVTEQEESYSRIVIMPANVVLHTNILDPQTHNFEDYLNQIPREDSAVFYLGAALTNPGAYFRNDAELLVAKYREINSIIKCRPGPSHVIGYDTEMFAVADYVLPSETDFVAVEKEKVVLVVPAAIDPLAGFKSVFSTKGFTVVDEGDIIISSKQYNYGEKRYVVDYQLMKSSSSWTIQVGWSTSDRRVPIMNGVGVDDLVAKIEVVPLNMKSLQRFL